jgi:hypothetical protein
LPSLLPFTTQTPIPSSSHRILKHDPRHLRQKEPHRFTFPSRNVDVDIAAQMNETQDEEAESEIGVP